MRVDQFIFHLIVDILWFMVGSFLYMVAIFLLNEVILWFRVVIFRLMVVVFHLWWYLLHGGYILVHGGRNRHRCKKGWNAVTMFPKINWVGRNIRKIIRIFMNKKYIWCEMQKNSYIKLNSVNILHICNIFSYISLFLFNFNELLAEIIRMFHRDPRKNKTYYTYAKHRGSRAKTQKRGPPSAWAEIFLFFSFFLFRAIYFFPRRGCPRVLKFCTEF